METPDLAKTADNLVLMASDGADDLAPGKVARDAVVHKGVDKRVVNAPSDLQSSRRQSLIIFRLYHRGLVPSHL